jgi:hypothetical protein
VLFPDLGRDWDTLHETAERLAGLGDSLTVLRDRTSRRRGLRHLNPRRTTGGSRAEARAAALVLLGDTDGAAAIAERRLLSREW